MNYQRNSRKNYINKKFLYIILLGLLGFSQNNDARCAQKVRTNKRPYCGLRRCAQCLYGKTFLQPRSQNTNTARRAVGHHNFRHQYCEDKFTGAFTVTPQYGQTFKPYHIAQYFCATNTLDFTGSLAIDQEPDAVFSCLRCNNNILADYFGLSPAFDGTVILKPEIKTFLFDFELFLEFGRGVYFQAYTPLVRTKSGIGLCEKVYQSGLDTPFPAGYMADEQIEAPVSCISQALKGDVTFGDASQGLKYGKFCCENKITDLADVTFLLGYIFKNTERGYIGGNVQVTAPTGTRPNGVYIFEPIAGNGHHWELGLGMIGQRLIWEKDGEQTLHFNVALNFSHLFTTCQCRSFDLKCQRFWSRYILLKEFDKDGNYSSKLVPAINVTTLPCKVKINFQMDLNLMFAYNRNNWEFDFGYNVWLRSHEKICLTGKIPENRYAFKGIQNVSGLDANITESSATIYGHNLEDQEQVADQISPVFLKTSDIDISSAETPKSLTHKLYWHLSYAWCDKDMRATPYLGGGWEIEFESVNPRYTCPYKNTLYQWALMMKFGIDFS